MGVDTEELEIVEDFRALDVDDSVVVIELAMDDFRYWLGVGDGCDTFLRITSQCCASSAVISLICPFVILSEYTDRFRAGRAIIVLCRSLLKLVPVIALGCSRCSTLGL